MQTPLPAPSMWKPPRSDDATGTRLTGQVLARTQLTATDRDAMYALLAAYFRATDRAVFEADLDEKEQVILLRERTTGSIVGFSTQCRMRLVREGRTIYALFSGDTIVDALFWGESLLSRLWSHAAFAEAERLIQQDPAAEVYWFLICSGYKTFRFLPVFFREFYPHPHSTTASALKPLLDALGTARFGTCFDAGAGIIRLAHAAPLRDGVAELSAQRLRDPMVRFFAERNPGHALGDELACLTRLTRENLTAAGRRILNAGTGA